MKYKQLERYKIYEDGRVYSDIRNRFLKGDLTPAGYIQFTLYCPDKTRSKAHRLVAKMFMEEDPYGYGHLNHIDGVKLNNHFSNLEWTTPYLNNKHARDMGLNDVSQSNADRWECPKFREDTSKNISEGLIKSKAVAHKNNPRYRYSITQEGEELTRKDLPAMSGRAQSTVDVWIRKAAEGDSIPYFEKNNIQVVDIKVRSTD